jgi:hypothetical protein
MPSNTIVASGYSLNCIHQLECTLVLKYSIVKKFYYKRAIGLSPTNSYNSNDNNSGGNTQYCSINHCMRRLHHMYLHHQEHRRQRSGMHTSTPSRTRNGSSFSAQPLALTYGYPVGLSVSGGGWPAGRTVETTLTAAAVAGMMSRRRTTTSFILQMAALEMKAAARRPLQMKAAARATIVPLRPTYAAIIQLQIVRPAYSLFSACNKVSLEATSKTKLRYRQFVSWCR